MIRLHNALLALSVTLAMCVGHTVAAALEDANEQRCVRMWPWTKCKPCGGGYGAGSACQSHPRCGPGYERHYMWCRPRREEITDASEDSKRYSSCRLKRKENVHAPRDNTYYISRRPRREEIAYGVTNVAEDLRHSCENVVWTTLEHGGVRFPPDYTPHGIKLKYDGVPVDLTPEQEELATMYATMLESDYVTQPKKTFLDNFWAEFHSLLGSNHVIKSLDKCDFRDIYEHLMAEYQAKKLSLKALSEEEKLKARDDRIASLAKYRYATVDGKQVQVSNSFVRAPGLFRGRNEHPRMGVLKKRIYPRDITINIGPGAKVPEHPYPGQEWKEVRHDQTATWLAFWEDPFAIGSKREYVYLDERFDLTTKSDSVIKPTSNADEILRRSYKSD